ncbi:hypothetical protein AM1_E0223 (plasmid) [Acaryochloris marina MBIC11017]|uniref:Uncharacterized protein n=1 Tax=Acaryochloris marina (strain MBIC 11017) TaxID=329726 RepID=A8ZPQ6_ACAM1|nr:hypothetical protein AM1_E0223 [Acaryochloris marina MBIC11017]
MIAQRLTKVCTNQAANLFILIRGINRCFSSSDHIASDPETLDDLLF